MALSLNRVIIMGFLGSEPEERNANGHIVCTMSLGLSERYKNHKGEITENTDWIDVACFGNCAKFALSYLHKGDLVAVEGKLKTSRYTDKRTGEIRKIMQVHCGVNSLTIIRRKEDNTNLKYSDNSQQQFYQPAPPQTDSRQIIQEGYNNTYYQRSSNNNNYQNYSRRQVK